MGDVFDNKEHWSKIEESREMIRTGKAHWIVRSTGEAVHLNGVLLMPGDYTLSVTSPGEELLVDLNVSLPIVPRRADGILVFHQDTDGVVTEYRLEVPPDFVAEDGYRVKRFALLGGAENLTRESMVLRLIRHRMDPASARVLVEHLPDYIVSWLSGDFGDSNLKKSLIDMLAYALIKRDGAMTMARGTIKRMREKAAAETFKLKDREMVPLSLQVQPGYLLFFRHTDGEIMVLEKDLAPRRATEEEKRQLLASCGAKEFR